MAEMPELMTVPEVAALLRVNEDTVRRYVRAKELHGVRVGKGYRIPRASVEQFIERGGIAAGKEDGDRDGAED